MLNFMNKFFLNEGKQRQNTQISLLRTVSHWSKLTLRLVNNELQFCTWSGRVLIENEVNTKCDRYNRKFERLHVQQASSVQKYILSCGRSRKNGNER